MTLAMAPAAMRSIALAIAITAFIDPVWSDATPPPAPVIAIHLTAGEPAAIDAALRRALRDRRMVTRAATGHRLPCAADEECVIIADGSHDVDWDAGARPVSLITTTTGAGPNVAVRSATILGAYREAAGVVRVELAGQDVEGKRSEVRILDGAAVVGFMTHHWSAARTVTLDIPWWAIGEGARTLRIEAVPLEGELTALDNHIDAGASIATSALGVFVFDARPSWNSTFVRRSLEDDPRFSVGYRSRAAPALAEGAVSTRFGLDEATLQQLSVAIVGGPEALTPAEVAMLDRYLRVRGGTVILLPEQRPSGAAAALVHGRWTEHLTAKPEMIGPLRATEILRVSDVPITSTVLAHSGSAAAIVSTPVGKGRIIVSGAMDAWRYRDSAFDRFWRSLVAAAGAASEALTLTFDRQPAARGARTRFTIRDRRFARRATAAASALYRCNGGPAQPIRVWPTGTLGEFAGELPAASPGSCTVEASVDDQYVSRSLAVVDRPARGVETTLARLGRAAQASGGVVVQAGNEAAVARALAAAPREPSRVVSVHPMRQPWWILPFAGCLSAEWWLRRRNGLR
jgi:hypothetical protein